VVIFKDLLGTFNPPKFKDHYCWDSLKGLDQTWFTRPFPGGPQIINNPLSKGGL